MLGEGYFIIDGVGYTPSDFDISQGAVENINTSEKGTDIVTVVRLDKKTFNLSWTGLTGSEVDNIEKLCTKFFVEVNYRGRKYICRARNFTSKLLTQTYKYKKADGLWNASMSLIEI